MKKILAIILMLMPLFGYSQSPQSDEYYNRGVKLYNEGKFKDAIPFFEKSDSIDKAEACPRSYYSTHWLASCYYKLGDETKAAEIYPDKYLTPVVDRRLTVESDSLADQLDALTDAGDYKTAITYLYRILEIEKIVAGDEHPWVANDYDWLSYCMMHTNKYAESEKYINLYKDIYLKTYKVGSPQYNNALTRYASRMHSLAYYNGKIGNYTEAIRLGTQAMEIRRKVLGEEHPDYASSLGGLASYNSSIGNYTEAIRLGTQALEIFKKVLGEEHPVYAQSLSNLASYNFLIGNYTEAIRLCTQALEIQKKTLGEEHPDYAGRLGLLSFYYYYSGDYAKSSDCINRYYSITKRNIRRYFSTMTHSERSLFWGKYDKVFQYMPMFAYKYADRTNYELAYNSQLFAKGLTLNAELEIQKLIEQSTDTTFANRYYKIRNLRTTLDRLYEIEPSKRQMDADSLAKVIEKEEQLLVESSKELGDYTKNISIEWQDVQKNLKRNDIAIEFANFYDRDTRQQVYVASVLKKGMKYPDFVKLDFSETDLSNCYTNSNLYNAIWRPLEKYLKGVENVYFAPSGKFHTIAIEYLPDDSGDIFAQKYNAYRLSSTRELALPHIINPNKNAAVYGGLVYDFGRGDWQDLLDYQDEIAMETSFRDLPDVSEVQRAGITFLQGAKIESDEIVNILRNNKYLVSQGTGVLGTETSFKKLSGSGVKILHIATHGFYEPENKEQKTTNFLMTNDKSNKEDNSLSRSGLFLAGASSALDPDKRKDIPEGVDDGILTAKEISRLDFKGLDLVVLSACQTGLGEVTSEGVFGLQRGFKKAGAQTIVMSLWSVDDNATKDLMTEFYKNLVSGKTKREAFISAQDFLRNKYQDPRKWAAFVMVDGIE